MMNMELEEIRRKLVELKPVMKGEFKVKTIGLFGSYIKGQEKEKSDLDILVEFEEPISLLKFIALENYLSDSLGVKVDLVEKSALKPRIGKHILKEVVNV
ncbi:MAG: Nucleotidyltransferase domain protein [Candidatus Bathyarchaeota archaeon BA2]|nr:MAG: Nucleotidyltransferase domain protein [Candidatus Bathyarchaeota archaeon BA2]